jgi:hypothetical protein
MKTEEEIKAQLKEIQEFATNSVLTVYFNGFRDALEWVLED